MSDPPVPTLTVQQACIEAIDQCQMNDATAFAYAVLSTLNIDGALPYDEYYAWSKENPPLS